MKAARHSFTLLAFVLVSLSLAHAQEHHSSKSHPNILFVIMDDVGIDQMSSFGYGGPLPPKMPVIDTVAYHGIRFRNAWSMPECSPARAAFFTGRWPLRNNIFQAIGPNDLNNSQVATWEITVPKLLADAHYESGLIGKFHLGGPENNEAGDGAPASVGFNDFYGWTGGLPGSIDTNAGLGAELVPATGYSCGFVPDAAHQGANSGACYFPTSAGGSQCTELSGTNPVGDSVGLQCLTAGGVLVPGQTCQAATPDIDFNTENAHYVSPLVVNRNGGIEAAALTDPRGRGFRATIEVNAAIDWINRHSSGPNPWMATVSFSIDHTPLQPPPGVLLSPQTRALLQTIGAGTDCTSLPALRLLSNAMIEAMDTEFGRLLVQTGLATRDGNGNVVYDPGAINTVIVIVGDNGSLGQTVKLPLFDPSRAKATAYQTGVWVPLIVAGPMVVQPGRQVDAMVNEVDMFQLFGEIAGIDVKHDVPRPIDSYPMMPYLTNPKQASLRPYNFTQGGLNLQKDGAHNGPCVIQAFEGSPAVCTQTPVSQSVCMDNGGTWWGGPGSPDLDECWQVNQFIYKQDPAHYDENKVDQSPQTAIAVRNQDYKLVHNEWLDYNPKTDDKIPMDSMEFYRVNEGVPPEEPLLLDRAGLELPPGGLTKEQQKNFDSLLKQMNAVLASAPECLGDGNGDGVVDDLDVADYYQIFNNWGKSSHYDFNYDGLTDPKDLQIIYEHFGQCPQPQH